MRLSTRMKVTVLVVLTCLALLFSALYIGKASAQVVVHPHISVTPHQVIGDASGCASVKITGRGFTPSTLAQSNYAYLTAFDADGDAYVASYPYVSVNANGRFAQDVTICGGEAPEEDVYVTAYDGYTGIQSNTVRIEFNS